MTLRAGPSPNQHSKTPGEWSSRRIDIFQSARAAFSSLSLGRLAHAQLYQPSFIPLHHAILVIEPCPPPSCGGTKQRLFLIHHNNFCEYPSLPSPCLMAPLDGLYGTGHGMLLRPRPRPIRLFCADNNREAHMYPMGRYTVPLQLDPFNCRVANENMRRACSLFTGRIGHLGTSYG